MLLAATISVAAFAQSTEPTTAFEIADVHVSPRSRDLGMRTSVRTGRYELHNATMLDLIRLAYSVDADKILGGPASLDYDRFDVLAKIPSKTPSQDTLKLMLQSLLADRFNLVLHKDTKPVAGLVLSATKGKPKFKEAGASRETGCKRVPGLSVTAGASAVPMIAYACSNITMDAFAAALRGMAPDYLKNAVVDGTGLKGSWDFEIKWTGLGLRQLTTEPIGVSLFDAIDQQLGLKLEEQKIPTSVIVVDQVSEKPTDNSPDLATRFPPMPLEFEVADIKPSPAAPGRGLVLSGVQPGGRLNWSGLPLTFAIPIAWNILTSDIVGAPKWLGSTPFDVIAKLPSDFVPTNGALIPLQDVGPALQALLIDRFKMKVHFEDRPVTAYTLVAAKPKLKEADPAGRTGCKASGASGFAVSTPFGPIATDRKITCQNITMAQFADQLQILAGPYIHYPALDGTGIAGAWDFSFTYSAVPPAELAAARGAPPAGGAVASDPVGGTSLFDALEKQLGLKLEMQKRPYPQLVIDHIEEKPTEN